MNLLEINMDIVHAAIGDGKDYTLCGITAENVLSDMSQYDSEDENTELVPCMIRTKRKIDCPVCATIIRYCCKLGLRSIKEGCAK